MPRRKGYIPPATIILAGRCNTTRIISVISGKGGTGKTTITANLGAALSKIGKSVLVIDGNISGANLGAHLGIPEESQVTLNDVLKNKAFLTQAVLQHPSGFSIIPASIGDINAELGGLRHNLSDFVGGYNIILIDAAAGVNKEVEAAIDASDEVLIVTNPDHPAVKNAGIAKKAADSRGKKTIGVVLNRVSGEPFEMPSAAVEKAISAPVISKITDHRKVRESLSVRAPVVHHAPHTEASREIMKLAHMIAGEKMQKETVSEMLRRLWNLQITISIG